MSRHEHDQSQSHEQDARQATQPAADHPPAPPVLPDLANGSEATTPRPDTAQGATVTSLDPVVPPQLIGTGEGHLEPSGSTTALKRVPSGPPTLDLFQAILMPLADDTELSPYVPPVKVETYLGPGDEPMARFRNLKGVPPALKLFEKGRRNRTVEMLLRGEMLKHGIKHTAETFDDVYHSLAAAAITAHIFNPLDNELVWVVRIVAAEHASEAGWKVPLAVFHRHCLFAALQAGVDTNGWGSPNWFSRRLGTLDREFEAVGVEIQDVGKKERGQFLRVRYYGPREDPADGNDAILPRMSKRLKADLRSGEPAVVLLTGRPDRTQAEVDRLTKLVFCTGLPADAPCGQCRPCRWYHYAEAEANRDPELSLAQLPMPTLHVKAAGADAVTLSGKLSQHVAAKRFVAVIEDIDKSADGFQKTLSAVIEKESRVLWILTAQQEARVLEELAPHVQHHVVC